MLVSLLLLMAVVMFTCTAFHRLSNRLGVPALLAFLFLGMLFGSDGLFKIPFEDYAFADQVSTVALLFIMSNVPSSQQSVNLRGKAEDELGNFVVFL